MGVLNVTPDSFSDGGQYALLDAAVKQACIMVSAGADIIDIGGESTRPNATPVSVEEELARVIPVIRAIRSNSDAVISIDTSKAEVMKRAVEAGANMINDVYALRQLGAIDIAASLNVPVCLMHMQATPESMQEAPSYTNIVEQVNEFFVERLGACISAGIKKENIILDPGFGFGKTLQHNLSLLANLNSFKVHGCPILAGLSRKSMLGELLGKQVNERVIGSVSAALMAVVNGASIVRVHDVAQTSDALKIYNALHSVN
ncbi:MAG: dihydropteroate synthase [Cycloclasticus sp. symbiont of Bathymodiolus heckerae]|nr:MAG: dihydropteroate synthase [Cycloclasticus sp. symbiont of Bathymodiolus heckerae]